MTLRDRQGLVARIRQIRRAAAAEEGRAAAAEEGRAAAAEEGRAAAATTDPNASRVQALEARVAHLERLVEGLQDSVHRESERQGKLIAELQAQVQPAAMSAALTKDARDRGL